MIDRRGFLKGAAVLLGTAHLMWSRQALAIEPWAEKLLAAAGEQVGETARYDPTYLRLDYPGGDVPRERGVCTDVIVRAYRDGLGLDLQRLVHEDMKRSFAAYPRRWGLSGPDRNIDHRRVPNLQVFFRRKGAELPMSNQPADYRAGDMVSQMLPGNLPHIALVSSQAGSDGVTPMLIHNIGVARRSRIGCSSSTLQATIGSQAPKARMAAMRRQAGKESPHR